MKTLTSSRHARVASSIERLEGRIAPAQLVNPTTVTFTDIDGDLVTVKTTAGVFDLASQFTFIEVLSGGEILSKLQIDGAAFQGAAITITAKPVAGAGNGSVNIGQILSTNDLALIDVDGDLNSAVIGDATKATPGLGVLHASSVGRINGPGGGQNIVITGSLGELNIAHNFNSTVLSTQVPSPGDIGIGSVTIGGSMTNVAGLDTNGTIGPVKIGGDVRISSGGGTGSGRIHGAAFGDVTIGGDFATVGNSGGPGATLESETALGVVKIGGDLRGSMTAPSSINALNGDIPSVRIGGSIFNGRIGTIGVGSGGSIGEVRVAGDMVSAHGSGPFIASSQNLGPVNVRGSILSDGEGASIFAQIDIASVKIGHDIRVVGGNANNAGGGSITALGALGNVAIGGSVDAGGSVGDFAGAIYGGTIAGVKIKGSLLGGSGDFSGNIGSSRFNPTGGVLGAVNIGGDLRGGAGPQSGSIHAITSGAIKIGGDLAAGTGSQSGSIQASTVAAPGIAIGGSIDARALGSDSTSISVGLLPALKVKGSILGNAGLGGRIESSRIEKFNVGHSIAGISAIHVSNGVDSFKVGGSIRGASVAAPVNISFNNGVSGVVVGQFSVKGDVENTTIVADVAQGGGLFNNDTFNSISVGGDWIASNLVVATLPGTDGLYGTADDPVSNSIARIGSITIAGVGEGTSSGIDDHFGIVAPQIDKLKINGNSFALTLGAHNDTSVTAPAHNIGTTLDFTVHES